MGHLGTEEHSRLVGVVQTGRRLHCTSHRWIHGGCGHLVNDVIIACALLSPVGCHGYRAPPPPGREYRGILPGALRVPRDHTQWGGQCS